MWLDAHLDLAYTALDGRDLTADPSDRNRACVTLPTLRSGGVRVVFGTIFTAPNEPGTPTGYDGAADVAGAHDAGRRQLELYEALEQAGELTIVRDAADLDLDDGSGRIGQSGGASSRAEPRLVLLMEGADPIRDPSDVAAWHARGLRMVGLTWALGTRYAGGNAAGDGLTAAGHELVAALDAVHMVHDVSHLSDAAFDDVAAAARGPLCASHSNCRALVADDQRHLRDEQVRLIAARGGMIGVNLFGRFLTPGRRAGISDVVRQVEHVAELCEHRGHVGLGSDMDGGFAPGELPRGLEGPDRLDGLAEALGAAGWSADDVEGFRCRNWHSFITRALACGRGAM